eukprot:16435225-Heterocapsa_arctica.AAC.1
MRTPLGLIFVYLRSCLVKASTLNLGVAGLSPLHLQGFDILYSCSMTYDTTSDSRGSGAQINLFSDPFTLFSDPFTPLSDPSTPLSSSFAENDRRFVRNRMAIATPYPP